MVKHHNVSQPEDMLYQQRQRLVVHKFCRCYQISVYCWNRRIAVTPTTTCYMLNILYIVYVLNSHHTSASHILAGTAAG